MIKWTSLNLKTLALLKTLWRATDYENIFANHISNKELLSGIYKDFSKLKKKENNLKIGETLEQTLQ